MSVNVCYVDDEARNLTVFEAAVPEDWQIATFDQPLQALKELAKISPSVIISDQRMPGMTGVEFLEIAKNICPDAVRIIVTGYSDEDLIIRSVRTAQIFDYIRKPWNVDELVASIERGHKVFEFRRERDHLLESLKRQREELEEKNKGLETLSNELKASVAREQRLRSELASWVPPFILSGLENGSLSFPFYRDIVGVTYDIINSGSVHRVMIDKKPLRNKIIEMFFEIALKNGGCREGHSGDQAYVHFGLNEISGHPSEAALATAREFRTALNTINKVHNVGVECGIGIHLARNSLVMMHSAEVQTAKGSLIQRSFDTSSEEIDLLFRMEKLVHALPGTNMIMTQNFVESLKNRDHDLCLLGRVKFKNMGTDSILYLVKSYFVTDEILEQFKHELIRKFSAVLEAA